VPISIKATLIGLFEKGVIVQAILTLGIVGVCLYMFATGKEVPSTLIQWAGFMMGLYGAGQVGKLMKGDDA